MKWKLFEGFVQQTMQEENIPGLAVAISQSGKAIYQKGFGVSDVETQAPASPETIFGIASVTKSFTALAIMQLANAGLLSVDDAVCTILADFRVPGTVDVSAIKVHHLLSHTTGIPPMRRREDLRSFPEHIAYLANEDYQVLGQPGEYLSYCNDAFLLLGAIIEKVSGLSYRQYVMEKIIRPLSLERSTLDADSLVNFKDVSVPYVYNRQEERLEKYPWPRLGNYEVGGGVRSCALDLLKYGQIYVDGPAYVKEMYVIRHQIARNAYYGYALKVTKNHGSYTLVEHGGGQVGVSSNFGFVPEEKLVVVVLSNVTGVSASRIWLAAVNIALGLPLQYSVSAEYAVTTPPEVMQKFVGKYQSAEGGQLVVSTFDSQTRITFEGQDFELHFAGGDTCFFNYRGQKVVRFYVDGSGKAWAAFVGLRMLRRKKGTMGTVPGVP